MFEKKEYNKKQIHFNFGSYFVSVKFKKEAFHDNLFLFAFQRVTC